MEFIDIHIHALYGVDDGAIDERMMLDMIDAAYKDGTRGLCLTPHFHLGYFGDNHTTSEQAFEKLKEYCEGRYPDLQLSLGNELRGGPSALEWLHHGQCRTINNTRYVLVDFSLEENVGNILSIVYRLIGSGYVPVLAHAERYINLTSGLSEVLEMRNHGVLIQVDSQSILGDFGRDVKKRSHVLLKNYWADIVSSDAHDLKERPPVLSIAYNMVENKYGSAYAQTLFYKNARVLFKFKCQGKQED